MVYGFLMGAEGLIDKGVDWLSIDLVWDFEQGLFVLLFPEIVLEVFYAFGQ